MQKVLTNLRNFNLTSIQSTGKNWYACTTDSGIYISNDSGLTWQSHNRGLIPNNLQLAKIDTFLVSSNNWIFNPNTESWAPWSLSHFKWMTYSNFLNYKDIAFARAESRYVKNGNDSYIAFAESRNNNYGVFKNGIQYSNGIPYNLFKTGATIINSMVSVGSNVLALLLAS